MRGPSTPPGISSLNIAQYKSDFTSWDRVPVSGGKTHGDEYRDKIVFCLIKAGMTSRNGRGD